MKFDLILADPPWSFNCWGTRKSRKGGTAFSHYNTMTLADIKALDIKSIANNDCVLLLWTPLPNLQESIEVIMAWGFKYKTVAFVWVKRNKDFENWFLGMGYYTRANAELCLIATRGKGLKRQSKSVKQIIETVRGRHSEKPQEQYKRIDQLFGKEIFKVELFARRKVEGWVCLGNEIDGKDIREAINDLP